MLRGQVVDALRGYHELGFAVTGHEHWRAIKQDRRESAADSLSRCVAGLPPKVQASILLALAWASVGVVSVEMFAAPVYASLKVNAAKKKAAADAAKEKKDADGGASK